MARRPKEWAAGADYVFGDVRIWCGVRLTCCLNHTAKKNDKHPWAAGREFEFNKAVSLWAPSGMVEAEKLYEISQHNAGTFQRVLLAAAGRLGLEAA